MFYMLNKGRRLNLSKDRLPLLQSQLLHRIFRDFREKLLARYIQLNHPATVVRLCSQLSNNSWEDIQDAATLRLLEAKTDISSAYPQPNPAARLITYT